MTRATHATQAPLGELDLLFVRINHPTWAASLRYGFDVSPWTVTDEESNSVVFPASGADADAAPTDDTGIDSRQVRLPDPNLTLWKRLETLSQTGDLQPVEVTIYEYHSTDLTEPVAYAILEMASPSRDGRVVSFEAANVNTLNRDAPSRRFTFANSPGLRR